MTTLTPQPPAQKKPLLEQMRDALRARHYSIRTETSYMDWARRFILFHNKRHPETMGAPEINAFLTHLAVEQNVAASTQTQALSAILFLYRDVLYQDLDEPLNIVRAKKPERLPVVLTRQEVANAVERDHEIVAIVEQQNKIVRVPNITLHPESALYVLVEPVHVYVRQQLRRQITERQPLVRVDMKAPHDRPDQRDRPPIRDSLVDDSQQNLVVDRREELPHVALHRVHRPCSVVGRLA